MFEMAGRFSRITLGSRPDPGSRKTSPRNRSITQFSRDLTGDLRYFFYFFIFLKKGQRVGFRD